MTKTRLSLFYLVGYTSTGGLAFMVAPQMSLKLFFATGEYNDLMVRMVGMFMIAIAIIASQIIRHRAEIMYPTTLMVRGMILCCMTAFYIMHGDRMLLILIGIVGLGFVLTGTSYLLERKEG